jgi:16S rRNA G966 N2-methylase RsmD
MLAWTSTRKVFSSLVGLKAIHVGLLVQGDNLDALKTLLPCCAERVECVYIDPPYNKGK